MSAIREATRAELADHGYSGVTFEGVARRARTSKPVLYRRYRSRAQMVADALPTLRWQPDRTTSAGSLRADLLILVNAMLDRFHQIGIETYRRLIAEADGDLLDDITARLHQWVERTIYPALSDARERGEIGGADIPDRVVMVIAALVRHELFLTHHGADEATVIEMLDTVYLPLIAAVSHQSDSLLKLLE
jgi:AcrR family transcriptional regulator